MAAKKASEPKETIFDHSLSFFKKRTPKSNDVAAQARIAGNPDPYGHVGSTKSNGPALQPVDYTQEPGSETDDDDPGSQIVQRTFDADDPLAEAYSLLQSHGRIHFGAQREDGSWEISALASPRATGATENSRSEFSPMTSTDLDPATQAIIEAELKKFAANPKR